MTVDVAMVYFISYQNTGNDTKNRRMRDTKLKDFSIIKEPTELKKVWGRTYGIGEILENHVSNKEFIFRGHKEELQQQQIAQF